MDLEGACRFVEENYPDLEARERKNPKDGISYWVNGRRIIRIWKRGPNGALWVLIPSTREKVVISRESQLRNIIEEELKWVHRPSPISNL